MPYLGARTALLLASLLGSSRSELVLEVQPGLAQPGEAVLVVVRGAIALPRGMLGELRLDFLPGPGGHEALVGLPVELEPGLLELSVEVDHPEDEAYVLELEGELEVTAADFPRRELTVARKYVNPPRSVRRKIAEDRAAFARAFAQPLVPRLFGEGFAWPRLSPITAPFGDIRLFNGRKRSQHFGMDLDGRVGDPVVAANDGKVVMARDCHASGKTVLVHHGAGLFTAYFHLSEYSVKVGAKVKRGQLLGQVGKTGRVTGPHLHWGAKVGGRWVDPESLMRVRW
ncbi:MAG: M23 family metallopeptidase [Myxococcales bacterium]|nr:M23 family metallopeptidase [Myxococcales bacterium]